MTPRSFSAWPHANRWAPPPHPSETCSVRPPRHPPLRDNGRMHAKHALIRQPSSRLAEGIVTYVEREAVDVRDDALGETGGRLADQGVLRVHAAIVAQRRMARGSDGAGFGWMRRRRPAVSVRPCRK